MTRSLNPEQWESFAQLRARSTPGAEAVRRLLGSKALTMSQDAIKSLAYRLGRDPRMRARIAAIVAEMRDGAAPETITAANVVALMEEVTVALEAAHAALARVAAPPETRTAVRRVLTAHLGRFQRLRAPLLEDRSESGFDCVAMISAALRPCHCGEPAPC